VNNRGLVDKQSISWAFGNFTESGNIIAKVSPYSSWMFGVSSIV
jgi:hypothetical protein